MRRLLYLCFLSHFNPNPKFRMILASVAIQACGTCFTFLFSFFLEWRAMMIEACLQIVTFEHFFADPSPQDGCANSPAIVIQCEEKRPADCQSNVKRESAVAVVFEKRMGTTRFPSDEGVEVEIFLDCLRFHWTICYIPK